MTLQMVQLLQYNAYEHILYKFFLIRTLTLAHSLQTSGRLMELSHKDGKLRVHYSDKLVTLLREVRQLAAFGFSVPTKIQHTANTAQKFYRHGVILKQVRVRMYICTTSYVISYNYIQSSVNSILSYVEHHSPFFSRLLISTTL